MTRSDVVRRVGLALLFLLPPASAVGLLALSGAVPQTVGYGLPDPGALTRWGLPISRAVRDLSAALTIGTLVLASTAIPGRPERRSRTSGAQSRMLMILAVSASVWAWATGAELVLTYSDVAGIPVGFFTVGALASFVTDFDLGRSLFVSLAIAAAVAFYSLVVRTVSGVGLLTLLALAGLWPLALTGHTSETDHELGVNAQALHLVAGAIWVGGLFALLLMRRALGGDFSSAMRRYSRLAGWCYAGVAISGLVMAWTRVRGAALTAETLTTAYGALLLVKVAALVVLGFIGWWHRRRLVPRLDSPKAVSALFRLVAGELVVMGVAFGAGVALGRTPPPGGAEEPASTAEALTGEPMPPPLGAAEWFTQWSVDTFWAPVAFVAITLYLLGVRRLARRGVRWSLGRTIAWVTGWLGVFWATSGSPGAYGEVLFSMHMVQHMTIATAAPAFLVLGAPITLALRALISRQDGSRGPREWLLTAVHSRPMRVVSHPLVAGAMFIGGLMAFYYSPLFELSLSTHTFHLLMTAHFLITGYLFANAICGVDPGTRRPPYPLRMVLLMVAFAYHAFFSISLMASDRILAEQWFSAFGRDWGRSLQDDQYLGASIGWALGDYPIAILGMALIVDWVRHDRREQTRLDRRADRDGDRDLEAYNEHLDRLTRGGPTSHRRH